MCSISDREQGKATRKQVDDANELYVIANRQV